MPVYMHDVNLQNTWVYMQMQWHTILYCAILLAFVFLIYWVWDFPTFEPLEADYFFFFSFNWQPYAIFRPS